jgi:type IV secretion system protein VirD4
MASGAITSKVRTVCGLVIRQRSSPSSRSRPLPLARPRSFWACLMKFLTWGAKLLLETIYAKGAGYGFGFPAQLAGNLKDITEKQFSGFYGEAGNATSWLAIPSLARLVCGDSFRTRNLLLGKADVFINLPLKVLQASQQVARVIVGALLNSVYEARGKSAGRILFLLDEVARLGYMGILETARDTGRKYGINLCLLYQSFGQLTQAWGRQGRQAWFDSAYLRIFSHIQDYEAADFLSKACGEFTAVGDSVTEGTGSSSGWDRSTSSSHRSTSQQQVARRLIKGRKRCCRGCVTMRRSS